MIDASIKDLSDDYERTLKGLYDRFLPEMDNQQATEHFKIMIKESVNASFAEAMELVHRFAVFIKY